VKRRKPYPIIGPWVEVTRQRRPGCTHCDKCKREFGPKEPFLVRETQVNYFRGDDEVEIYHAGCRP